MMKPGGVDGFLDVKAEVRHSHQNVRDRRDDGWSTRRAEYQKELAVFEHDGGRHRRERALVGWCFQVRGGAGRGARRVLVR